MRSLRQLPQLTATFFALIIALILIEKTAVSPFQSGEVNNTPAY